MCVCVCVCVCVYVRVHAHNHTYKVIIYLMTPSAQLYQWKEVFDLTHLVSVIWRQTSGK